MQQFEANQHYAGTAQLNTLRSPAQQHVSKILDYSLTCYLVFFIISSIFASIILFRYGVLASLLSDIMTLILVMDTLIFRWSVILILLQYFRVFLDYFDCIVEVCRLKARDPAIKQHCCGGSHRNSSGQPMNLHHVYTHFHWVDQATS